MDDMKCVARRFERFFRVAEAAANDEKKKKQAKSILRSAVFVSFH